MIKLYIQQLKQSFLRWLLSAKDKKADDLYYESNHDISYIPGPDGKLKFTGQGQTDTLVLTPDGYVPIVRTLKTVPYRVYTLKLDNGNELSCADHHLVVTSNGLKTVDELELDKDLVYTIDGPVKVRDVCYGYKEEEMYDFEVDHPSHLYYTNGILSHNTTVIAAYLLWFACFQFEKYVLVASKDNDAALDVMNRIRFAYEELPMWLKPGCLYFNKHEVTFDNNSCIKSSATTEHTGRGRAVSLLMLDELAFVSHLIQYEMWASLAPTLSTGGSCIISSTPNGDQDLFAQLWREAETGLNGFHPIFAPWYEHPERDEAYKIEMIGKVGLEMFDQEYECKFISSDPLLINSTKLQSMQGKPPIFEEEGFKFWEEIDPRKTYLIGMDVSEGLGRDFGVIQIFSQQLNQVAELRANNLSEAKQYDKLKVIIRYILKKKFNDISPSILWSFENNACGKVISTLYYADNDFPQEAELISAGEKFGMNTSAPSKAAASRDLKRLIEQVNGMGVNSAAMITEFKNYVQRGRSGVYEARAGSTDDSISAALIVARIFKYLSSYDDSAFMKLYRPDEEEGSEEDGTMEPMPFGIV